MAGPVVDLVIPENREVEQQVEVVVPHEEVVEHQEEVVLQEEEEEEEVMEHQEEEVEHEQVMQTCTCTITLLCRPRRSTTRRWPAATPSSGRATRPPSTG